MLDTIQKVYMVETIFLIVLLLAQTGYVLNKLKSCDHESQYQKLSYQCLLFSVATMITGVILTSWAITSFGMPSEMGNPKELFILQAYMRSFCLTLVTGVVALIMVVEAFYFSQKS